QEPPVLQHQLERRQLLGQTLLKRPCLLQPLVEAAAAELSFFVAQKTEPVALGQILLILRIVEAEAGPLDLVLDVTPQNAVNALERFGEKIQVELGGKIFGDDLRVLVRFEYDSFAVADHRDLIITLP